MKVLFMITLLSSFISCNKREDVLLKTNNISILNDFDVVLKKSELIICNALFEKKFSNHFKINTIDSYVRCDEKLVRITDSINCKPNFYRICYDFEVYGQGQQTIVFDFDSKLKLIDYDQLLLAGFDKFITGNLKIFKKDAVEKAAAHDISANNVEINFKTYRYSKNSPKYIKGNSTLYYWEVKKHCNHCKIILIDAKTGKIFQKGTTEYVY